MPNDRLSQAIKEAYASAPEGVITYQTLEIRNPQFVDEAQNPIAVRVVQDRQDLVATLENDATTAPLNTGETVTFTAVAFDLQPPKEEKTGGVPSMGLVIDNVSRELLDHLEAAVGSDDLTIVTYRLYLSTDLSGPQNSPPYEFRLRDVKMNDKRATIQLALGDVRNKRFPSIDYSATLTPGLIR